LYYSLGKNEDYETMKNAQMYKYPSSEFFTSP